MIQFKSLTEQHEWEWLKGKTSVIQCEDSIGIVAFDERGVQAVCIADSFTIDSCCVHIAIDNPFVIRAGFFREVARHLFITCGRNRIFGVVPANNEKALKFDMHMGFKEVARIPNAFKTGVDSVVLVMEKEANRWLTPEQQQEAA